MTPDVQPIPARFNTVNVYLVVPNCVEALDFYARAFSAQVIFRMPGPDGKSTMHAEMGIGNSTIMLSDENPEWNLKSPKSLGGCSASLHLYVDDADSVFDQAVNAGCTVLAPIADMFWGDRFGKVEDPYGYHWGIATHIEDIPPEEMERRAAEAFANMDCDSPESGA